MQGIFKNAQELKCDEERRIARGERR